MLWSGANLAEPDGTRLLRVTVRVPDKLSNTNIEEAVVMAASRLKWLMGQRYKEQIEARVTARHRVAR